MSCTAFAIVSYHQSYHVIWGIQKIIPKIEIKNFILKFKYFAKYHFNILINYLFLKKIIEEFPNRIMI